MIVTTDRFASHMEKVARKLWGEPNPHLSSGTELRFGSHGSKSVDLESGTYFDHEANLGGGVVDLVEREERIERSDVCAWLDRELGIEIPDSPDFQPRTPAAKAKFVCSYDYVDEHGEVLFQVCRFEPKTFRQRRPDPASDGGWNWNVRGLRQIPYRLPELLAAVARGQTVYVVEGEKDVEALAREGVAATCNAMGAGKWPAELAEHFAGADVVIAPDNDDAGRNHAALVATTLRATARRVRVLDIPGLPVKGDVSDWLSMGGDGEALSALAESLAKDWLPERPKSRFGAISFGDVDSVNVNYPPLVKGLIFQGDKGMIFGESGSGKSFLAVDMGLSIARGVPFLGLKVATGAVLYQAGEGGRGLVKRLRAYRQEHRVSDRSPFELLPEKVNLFAADGDTDAFIEECRAWQAYYAALGIPLLLIVIDTFSAASTGANENASEDMGRMLDAGDRLNHETGAAVVWVHHKNAAGLRERGHGSFRANIETAIEIRKDLETKARTLHLSKLKDGEDSLTLGFELQSVTIGTDDDGDPITSCVVRPAQVGMERTSTRRLPPGQFKFLKILDDAIVHRGAIVPPGPHTDGSTYGVNWHDFREMYVAIGGLGRSPEAIRQALKLDGDKLFNAGMIGKHDPWVWITEKGGSML